MKRYIFSISFIFVAFIFIWFHKKDGRISINSEYAKLYLLNEGYRSWTISYSHGHQIQSDGTFKNLWKWPTFHHVDVRKLYQSNKWEF